MYGDDQDWLDGVRDKDEVSWVLDWEGVEDQRVYRKAWKKMERYTRATPHLTHTQPPNHPISVGGGRRLP